MGHRHSGVVPAWMHCDWRTGLHTSPSPHATILMFTHIWHPCDRVHPKPLHAEPTMRSPLPRAPCWIPLDAKLSGAMRICPSHSMACDTVYFPRTICVQPHAIKLTCWWPRLLILVGDKGHGRVCGPVPLRGGAVQLLTEGLDPRMHGKSRLCGRVQSIDSER